MPPRCNEGATGLGGRQRLARLCVRIIKSYQRSTVGLLTVLELPFGFLLCDPAFLLGLAEENVAFTGHLIDFIIRQLASFLLHLTSELLPVTLYLLPVHLFLLSVHENQITYNQNFFVLLTSLVNFMMHS